MPYFPVDDQFAFHPKAVAAGNAAVGLWARAGSWCKNHTTGGFVPTDMAKSLGNTSQIGALLRVGLWLPAEGGYQFHDWDHQAGNFDAIEEKERREVVREKDRERKRLQREREKAERHAGHADSHTRTPGGIPSTPSPVPSPVTKDIQIRPVPETAEADWTKVSAAVQKHCGRPCDRFMAFRIIGTVTTRAKVKIKDPTGFVISAIERDPFEFQKMIDEAAA